MTQPAIAKTLSTVGKVFGDINELTELECGYAEFSAVRAILQKTVKMFRNNESRINKRIKRILKRKKLVFQKNENEKYRSVRKELKEDIRKEKKQ